VGGPHNCSGRFEEEKILLPHSLITTPTTPSELLHTSGAQFEAQMAFTKPVSECLAKRKENKLGYKYAVEYIWNYIFASCAESFIFQVAIQKVKDQDI